MADFCTNCHRDMGFPGEPDIDIENMGADIKIGYFTAVLCEGCGMTGVGLDTLGEIVVLNERGIQEYWNPDEDRMAAYDLRNNPEFVIPPLGGQNTEVRISRNGEEILLTEGEDYTIEGGTLTSTKPIQAYEPSVKFWIAGFEGAFKVNVKYPETPDDCFKLEDSNRPSIVNKNP